MESIERGVYGFHRKNDLIYRFPWIKILKLSFLWELIHETKTDYQILRGFGSLRKRLIPINFFLILFEFYHFGLLV